MAPITHRRFDDAEVDTPIPSLPENDHISEDGKSQENADSDNDSDDAPEAVTTSAARSATRNASAKIASTLQAQTEEARRKRQQREAEHTAALAKSKSKKTSKATSTSRSKATPKALPDADDDADTNNEAGSLSDDGDVSDADSDTSADPPLLPLSVLAAAEKSAKQQAQAEILRSAPVAAARKRRFVDIMESAPVRDLKVGRTAVRVLAKGPEGLPPKASKRSQSVKEGWLAGRRGQAGQRRR